MLHVLTSSMEKVCCSSSSRLLSSWRKWSWPGNPMATYATGLGGGATTSATTSCWCGRRAGSGRQAMDRRRRPSRSSSRRCSSANRRSRCSRAYSYNNFFIFNNLYSGFREGVRGEITIEHKNTIFILAVISWKTLKIMV